MAATSPIRPDETGDEKHRLVVHIPIALRDALQRAAVERSLGKPRIVTVSRLVRELLEREFGDGGGRTVRLYGGPRTLRTETGDPTSKQDDQQDRPAGGPRAEIDEAA